VVKLARVVVGIKMATAAFVVKIIKVVKVGMSNMGVIGWQE